MLLLSAILIIPLLAFIIVSVDKIESDFIRYHISSIIGHSKALLKAFVIATNSFIPDTLGSNSIATQVIAGTKNGLGIESTLLARFADYKYFFSFILVYIVYSYKRINVDIKKKFYIYFLLLLLFSSASNHPIVYLPTVYLLNNICKSNNFVT